MSRPRRQVVDAAAVETDFAGVGRVERAQQVQQRALARAALADDRQKLAAADFQIDSAQHGNFDPALAVAFLEADGRQLHGARPVGGPRRRRHRASVSALAGRPLGSHARVRRRIAVFEALLIAQGLHGMQTAARRAGRMLATTAIAIAPATIQATVNGSTIVGIFWK